MPYIPELLRKERFDREESYTKASEPNIKAYYKADLPINIDEDTYNVHLTVREDQYGNFFWDAQIKEEPQHATPATNPGDTGLTSELSEDTLSISRNDDDVNKTLHQRLAGESRPQEVRGSFTRRPDTGEAIIKLFQTADASTVVHELGHFFLDDMRRFADNPETESNIVAYWKADLPINIDSDTYNVHLTVKEDNNGNFFWDAQVNEKAPRTDPATNPGDKELSTSADTAVQGGLSESLKAETAYNDNITQNTGNVNDTLYQTGMEEWRPNYEQIEKSEPYIGYKKYAEDVRDMIRDDVKYVDMQMSINRLGGISSYLSGETKNGEAFSIRISDHDTNYDTAHISFYYGTDKNKFVERWQEFLKRPEQRKAKAEQQEAARKEYIAENLPEEYIGYYWQYGLKALKKAVNEGQLPPFKFTFKDEQQKIYGTLGISWRDVKQFINNGNDALYQTGELLTECEGGYKIADDNETVEAVVIPENAVPEFKTRADLRNWLIGKFNEIGNVTIKSTGANVEFNKTGAQRAIKNARQKKNNIAYPEIEKVVSGAKYSGFREADERHQNVKGQDVYHSGVIYKGVPYSVEFYVDVPLSGNTGDNFAGNKIREIKIAPTETRVTSENQNRPANNLSDAISNISLAVLRGKVKPARYDAETGALYQTGAEFGWPDYQEQFINQRNAGEVTHYQTGERAEPVKISGKEFGEYTADRKAYGKAFAKYYKDNIAGTSVVSPVLGEVKFFASSINETSHHNQYTPEI